MNHLPGNEERIGVGTYYEFGIFAMTRFDVSYNNHRINRSNANNSLVYARFYHFRLSM